MESEDGKSYLFLPTQTAAYISAVKSCHEEYSGENSPSPNTV